MRRIRHTHAEPVVGGQKPDITATYRQADTACHVDARATGESRSIARWSYGIVRALSSTVASVPRSLWAPARMASACGLDAALADSVLSARRPMREAAECMGALLHVARESHPEAYKVLSTSRANYLRAPTGAADHGWHDPRGQRAPCRTTVRMADGTPVATVATSARRVRDAARGLAVRAHGSGFAGAWYTRREYREARRALAWGGPRAWFDGPRDVSRGPRGLDASDRATLARMARTLTLAETAVARAVRRARVNAILQAQAQAYVHPSLAPTGPTARVVTTVTGVCRVTRALKAPTPYRL